MLSNLKLHEFRCFPRLETEFAPGMNLISGANAQGKSTLLEAICVLLRLESPRVTSMNYIIRRGAKGFAVQGQYGNRWMQFYYGERRRKLALDQVEQKTARQYLGIGHAVFMASSDRELVHGSPAERRRFLDLLAAQVSVGYRKTLRDYQKALASRNALLKEKRIAWDQVRSYDGPLCDAGEKLLHERIRLVERLLPLVQAAQTKISAEGETAINLRYLSSAEGIPLPEALEKSRDEEARLRQTIVGPHRDDLLLSYDDQPLINFASEGQQRTAAIALKLSEYALIKSTSGQEPLLLIDDVFGELDPIRRNNLLDCVTGAPQIFVTATSLSWLDEMPSDSAHYRVADGRVTLVSG